MTQFFKAFINKEFSANEVLLYGVLFSLCSNPQRICQKSVNDLINLFPAKIARRTMIYALESLENKGIISVVRTGKFKNIYSLVIEPDNFTLCKNCTSAKNAYAKNAQDLVQNLHNTSAEFAPPLVQNLHQTSAKNAPLIRSNIDLLIDRILDLFYRASEKKLKNPTVDFFNPNLNLPTQEIVEYVVKEKQIKEVTKTAEDFLNYYQSTGWKNSKGLQITDWLAALNYWCSKAKEKEQNPNPKFFKRDCDKSIQELADEGADEFFKYFGVDLNGKHTTKEQTINADATVISEEQKAANIFLNLINK